MRVTADQAIAQVRSFSLDSLEQLIADATLRQQGAQIFHVIDPFEISRFCFPVIPADPRNVDLISLGSDQIGLYEIFYRSDKKPILAEEYDKEMKAILDWAQANTNAFYSKVEMVEELLALAGYDEEEFQARLAERGAAEAVTSEKSLRVLLAAVLGIHSHGVERLREVCSYRIERGFSKQQSKKVREISDDYDSFLIPERRRTNRYKAIWKIVREFAMRSGANLRHARYDADIIDRLFHMNIKLERAHQEGEIPHRILYQYVSSAPRTKRLFKSEIIRSELPRIDGEPFVFWRNSRQLFLYAVRRAVVAGKGEDYNKTILRLNGLRDLVREDVSRLERERCAYCILLGETPFDCSWSEVCIRIEDLRTRLESELVEVNDAFLGGKLETYASLANISEGDAAGQSPSLIRAILELRDQGAQRDFLIQRALDSQTILGTKGAFLAGLSRQARNIFGEVVQEDLDSVTASSQFFPRAPKVGSSEYRVIWRDVLRFFDDCTHGEMRLSGVIPDSLDRGLLIGAYDRFLAREAEVLSEEQEVDHELVRVLLYLSFSTRKYGKRAFELACRKSEIYGERSAESLEFFYLALWSGRRAKLFRETDCIAQKAIGIYPKDPRLFHGAALNISSWILEVKHEDRCPYSLERCIAFGLNAIKLYERDDSTSQETLAASYNNLVFWYSLDERDDAFDLVLARKALVELKRVLDKEDWIPKNPEYHHTEANLELKEAEAALFAGDLAAARRKLRCAHHDAKIAVDIFPRKGEHVQTLQDIENLAEKHSIEIGAPK